MINSIISLTASIINALGMQLSIISWKASKKNAQLHYFSNGKQTKCSMALFLERQALFMLLECNLALFPERQAKKTLNAFSHSSCWARALLSIDSPQWATGWPSEWGSGRVRDWVGWVSETMATPIPTLNESTTMYKHEDSAAQPTKDKAKARGSRWTINQRMIFSAKNFNYQRKSKIANKCMSNNMKKNMIF